MDRERIHHPAIGKVSCNVFQGTTNFVGSDVPQHGGVRFTVERGIIERDLDKQYIRRERKDNHVVTFEMSSLQFAELISIQMNSDGVACTLLDIGKERIEPYNPTSAFDNFKREYDSGIDHAISAISDIETTLQELLRGGKINKTTFEQINTQVSTATRELKGNTPFIKKQFDQYMDRVDSERKLDAEVFLSEKLKSIGITALKDEQGRIE